MFQVLNNAEDSSVIWRKVVVGKNNEMGMEKSLKKRCHRNGELLDKKLEITATTQSVGYILPARCINIWSPGFITMNTICIQSCVRFVHQKSLHFFSKLPWKCTMWKTKAFNLTFASIRDLIFDVLYLGEKLC